MSNKIELNLVAGAMQKHAVDPEVMRAIIADLQAEADAKDTGEEKPPAVKKQFVVLVSDALGRLPREDFVAWVVQIPDSESPATTEDRIVRTAHDYNSTKRGRQLPVQTVGECIESAKSKHFRANDVWVKTRTPVLVVRTRNEIPETPSLLSDADRKFGTRDGGDEAGLVANVVVSHTGALPDSKISNQAPSPGVGL